MSMRKGPKDPSPDDAFDNPMSMIAEDLGLSEKEQREGLTSPNSPRRSSFTLGTNSAGNQPAQFQRTDFDSYSDASHHSGDSARSSSMSSYCSEDSRRDSIISEDSYRKDSLVLPGFTADGKKQKKSLKHRKKKILQNTKELPSAGITLPTPTKPDGDGDEEEDDKETSFQSNSRSQQMESSFASISQGMQRFMHNKDRAKVVEQIRKLLTAVDTDKDDHLTVDQVYRMSQQLGFQHQDMELILPEMDEKTPFSPLGGSPQNNSMGTRSNSSSMSMNNVSMSISGPALNSPAMKLKLPLEVVVQRMADVVHGPEQDAQSPHLPGMNKRNSILKTISAAKDMKDTGMEDVSATRAMLLVRLQSIVGESRRAAADGLFKKVWDLLHLMSIFYFYVMVTYNNVYRFQRETILVHSSIIVVYVFWVLDIILTTQLATVDEDRRIILKRKEIVWRKRHIIAMDVLGAFPLDVLFYHMDMMTPMLICRMFKIGKMIRVSYLFEAVNLDHVTPSLVTFYFHIRPLLTIVFYSACFAHTLTIVFFFTHAERVPFVHRSNEEMEHYQDISAYLTMLVLTLAMLTGAGPGVELDTTPDLYLGPLMILFGFTVQGIVIGKLAVLIFRADVNSSNLQLMRDTLTIIKHYKLPDRAQQEILSFQMHALNDSISRHMQDLETLPDRLQEEITVYMKVESINTVRLFKDAELDCRVELAGKLQRLMAEPEVNIVTIGDVGMEMFLMQHGYASVIIVTGIHVMTIARGDYFGEVALLTEGCTRQATVQSLTYCDLWSLHKKDFLEVLTKYPRLFDAVHDDMVAKGIDTGYLKTIQLQSLEDMEKIMLADLGLEEGSSEEDAAPLIQVDAAESRATSISAGAKSRGGSLAPPSGTLRRKSSSLDQAKVLKRTSDAGGSSSQLIPIVDPGNGAQQGTAEYHPTSGGSRQSLGTPEEPPLVLSNANKPNLKRGNSIFSAQSLGNRDDPYASNAPGRARRSMDVGHTGELVKDLAYLKEELDEVLGFMFAIGQLAETKLGVTVDDKSPPPTTGRRKSKKKSVFAVSILQPLNIEDEDITSVQSENSSITSPRITSRPSTSTPETTPMSPSRSPTHGNKRVTFIAQVPDSPMTGAVTVGANAHNSSSGFFSLVSDGSTKEDSLRETSSGELSASTSGNDTAVRIAATQPQEEVVDGHEGDYSDEDDTEEPQEPQSAARPEMPPHEEES